MNRRATQVSQRLAAQNAEPNLYHVEPRRICRNEMEVYVGMACQPPILLGLVSVEVVQNDVDVAAAVLGDDIVHEIEELSSASSRIMPYPNLASCDLQGGEQSAGSMTLVAVTESVQGLAVRQPQPSLCPLQNLNVRLFIHAQHHRIFGRT